MPSGGVGHHERRATRRVEFDVTVKVWRDETTVEAKSHNISAGGIKLEFDGGAVPFQIGERIDLEFTLELLGQVVTAGEVRWISANSCGVQFTALHPRVVSAINRLHSRG